MGPAVPDSGNLGALGWVLVPVVAAEILLLVASIQWLSAVTGNLERLGQPLEGSIWLRAFVGSIVPMLGAFMLFRLAARILDASIHVAGRRNPRRAWYSLWMAAFVASDVAFVLGRIMEPVPFFDLVAGVLLALSWPGLRRFLCTVEEHQFQSPLPSLPEPASVPAPG